MTIRKKTMAETIEDLKVIISNRKSRIEGLTNLVKSGCSAEDRKWITKEIAEHEKYISDTEKVIKNFYAPKGV